MEGITVGLERLLSSSSLCPQSGQKHKVEGALGIPGRTGLSSTNDSSSLSGSSGLRRSGWDEGPVAMQGLGEGSKGFMLSSVMDSTFDPGTGVHKQQPSLGQSMVVDSLLS